jgi:hypothetical protein
MNALTTRGASRGIATPNNIADAMRLAEMLANSTMVPQSYRGKPGDILVAVQMGAELGLSPMQSLQNITSINGRPSVWGDAALALVQGHPAYVAHREWIEGEGMERAGYCAITRRGNAEHVQRFSTADAKKAGLLGKAGPWTQYTDRMLVLRARGFALRDKFADALRGLTTAEEAQDIPPEEPRNVVGVVVPDQPAIAAPQPEPEAGRTARSFSFDLLDDQLSQFVEVEEIRAYLAQPKVLTAHRKVMERGMGERWAEIVQRHYSRVLPDEPDDEVPSEHDIYFTKGADQ